MNILDKITALREERHWTEYQLAEKSGLTQSTISSWYRKNMIPSVPSLEKVCNAFGITLSQFFVDDNNDNVVLINEQQSKLLKEASKLSNEQLDNLIIFLKGL